MRKFLIAAFILAVALPVYAVNTPVQQYDFRVSAQTGGKVLGATALSETQIQAILALLSSFNVDTAVAKNVDAALRGISLPVSSPPSGVSGGEAGTSNTSEIPRCVYVKKIWRTLSEGMRDSEQEDVTALQRFFAAEPSVYPGGKVTGYLGSATKAAIERWQCQNGIACSGDPGFGILGPNSRAAMFKLCGYDVPALPDNSKPVVDSTGEMQSVTIDYASYSNAVTYPIIRGKAQDVEVFGISVDNGDKVYASGNTIYPTNGEWAHQITTPLKPGYYNVKAYNSNNQLVGSGTFFIQSNVEAGVTLSASPLSIMRTQPTIVSWNVVDAKDCSLTVTELDQIGTHPVANYGYETMYPHYTTKYRLTCTHVATGMKLSSGDVVVSVTESPESKTSVDVKVNGIDAGAQVADNELITVTWNATNASSCFLSGSFRLTQNGVPTPLNNLPASGTKQVYAYVTSDPNYNHKVHLTCNRTDGTGSVSDFALLNPVLSANSIKVTAPNGGEQWEIGQMNTITWAPYGYNPDVNPSNQVVAYLQRLDGSTVGQIKDTGKASLHTYFNINDYYTWAEPGQYYVYVKNSTTGVADRSDAPFTLLPKSVDLKVNGSDGPVSVSGGKLTISWTSTGAVSCTVYQVADYAGGSQITDLPASGERDVYLYNPEGFGTTVSMACKKSNGTWGATDSVAVNQISTVGSLSVAGPNGGESLPLGEPYYISWLQKGLSSVSIALYRNDQWQKWIVKDLAVTSDNYQSYQWTPTSAELGAVNEFGSAFKIYITGQQISGGYLDDKSDAPFGFFKTQTYSQSYYQGSYAVPVYSQSSYYAQGTYAPGTYTQSSYYTQSYYQSGYSTTPTPTLSVSASPSVINSGQSTYLYWSSASANRCVLQYGSVEENVGVTGGRVLYPTQTTVYTIICVNDPGTGKDGPSVSAPASVTVSPQTYSQSSYGGGGGYGSDLGVPKFNLH